MYAYADQDTRLAQLSHSIGRQHHLSLQIGDELEVHQGLLDETDMALDRTQGNLGRARKRLDGFAEKAKNNGQCYTAGDNMPSVKWSRLTWASPVFLFLATGSVVAIVVLIVLLAILILVFKT